MPEFHESATTSLIARGGNGNQFQRGKHIKGYATVLDDYFTRDVLQSVKWYISYHGYMMSRIEGRVRYLHQVVYEHYHGQLPTGLQIDHRDQTPLNNVPSNLRQATITLQRANRKKQCNNKSGYKGVSWHSWGKKWCATVSINYKRMFLGLFADPKDAAKAVNKAYQSLYPEVSVPNPDVEMEKH